MLAYMARITSAGRATCRCDRGRAAAAVGDQYAVNGLMSIMYAMSRDKEMPELLQKLNSFGSPWIAAVVAAGVPASCCCLPTISKRLPRFMPSA